MTTPSFLLRNVTVVDGNFADAEPAGLTITT